MLTLEWVGAGSAKGIATTTLTDAADGNEKIAERRLRKHWIYMQRWE